MCHNLVAPTTNHKSKWESAGLMDSYCVIGVIAIPDPRFGVLINIISKKDIANRSQLVTYHIKHDLTLRNYHLNIWERKVNGRIANIFIICFNCFAKWIMVMTNSIMLQRTPTTRSYGYLNLQVLYRVSNIPSVVLNRMFEKYNE